ncbi:hypothetical protein HAX54_029475 [Datura stramonium]|uniref:Protein kinase domain-containing protein n=1 Tax=Datura stramonium TaxID=4076 RepID=A0ABS8V885_DATST|nr:hypothetical protein [Datura stramonium]
MAWKKLYVLGAGSYGKVYYAIKINSYELCASVAAVKCADIRRSISLQQEVQILTTLKNCPYLVQFFGANVSIDDGNIPTYDLFLEYACGGSLHDLIINSKKKMTKPTNILVFDNANECNMHKLKLANFGLSLKVGDGMAYMTGTPLSNRETLLYAPPKSLTDGFHGKAYDIRSLGALWRR